MREWRHRNQFQRLSALLISSRPPAELFPIKGSFCIDFTTKQTSDIDSLTNRSSFSASSYDFQYRSASRYREHLTALLSTINRTLTLIWCCGLLYFSLLFRYWNANISCVYRLDRGLLPKKMNDNLAIYGILFASDYDTDNDTLKKIFKGCYILFFL